LHFLVRLPPFTQIFIQYQDRNFDLPDRTFHSMATTWKLASGGSTTDFKELTPEFFYLPEFLQNNEQFNFGNRQHNGLLVDDVQLPVWCRKDPRLFVLINRQALECNHVSENLSQWIDLVFGFKQSGKVAEEAINVFHPATYYGVEVDNIEDPVRRGALEAMIKTFGQMPKQLFTRPHPSTSNKNDNTEIAVIGEVTGLKWGTYVGSPSQPDPCVLFKNQASSKIELLVPLANNDVIGLPPHSCLMVSYAKHRKLATLNSEVLIAHMSIITWNHADNVLRIKHREQQAMPFLGLSTHFDKVSTCASVPESGLLLVAFKSGSIAAYSFQEPVKVTLNISDMQHKRIFF